MIESISAVTLATHDMPRAVRFYTSLGFDILHGGEASSFTSLRAGPGYLNLIAQGEDKSWSWWGRIIFYVDDVDALYARALAVGHQPSTKPRDAEWDDYLDAAHVHALQKLIDLQPPHARCDETAAGSRRHEGHGS